ncbi:MAG: biotin--[acetyl-CoA-carboxylase] ligase [Gemmataceae bacterium]|nr:biotin--[acetyl-CoA-carboxylase] ligase [Gemmataceae bacterium]MDW8244270.1 biotin--[acetyl-CoA-carboxylase] ligase [Thermogemmata sp.]
MTELMQGVVQPEPEEIWCFPHRHVGRQVAVYSTLSSTNSLGAAWVARTEPSAWHGWAIVAREQTAGRGQKGRCWQAPAGKALLLSVLVQPPPPVARPVILTAWAAVAVAEAITAMTGLQAYIKWPNDLLLAHRKVCGILIECHGSATVAGIGLNLTQQQQDWSAAGLPTAISLAQAADRLITIAQAAQQVLYHLDIGYEHLIQGRHHLLLEEWRQRLGLLGRRVDVELSDGSRLTGQLHEVNFQTVVVSTTAGLYRWPPERIVHLYPTEQA